MKKKITMIILTILMVLFTIQLKVNAASIDLSKYTSEELADTLKVEGVTNANLDKYNIPNSKRVNIYIFRADGCQNCKNLYTNYIATKLLNSHGDKIKIITYEIKSNRINYGLLDSAKALLKEQAGSYSTPTIFIGNKTFAGDLASGDPAVPQKQAEIEKAIDALYNSNDRYDILEELTGTKLFTNNTTNITLTSGTRLDRNYVLKTTETNNQNIVLQENYNYIISYDISMYDENDKIVPLTNGSYKIKIPVNVKYDTYKVGYVKDGKIQEEFDATYSNNTIEFTTTHLSEYMIYGMNHKKPDVDQNVNIDEDQNQKTETIVNTTQNNKKVLNTKKEEQNPQTLDDIETYFIVLGLGMVVFIASTIAIKKKEN
ncbi:MAG: hypothetical protein HFJ33_00130 [Clostridia bacterium]|nr:hypothetical protein [Clostridia bacterium]